ncbi:hypothetical protein PTTG_26478 [Puccinia triticina 1-1 BBBD Race 1]|uniref:Uncharacterized protein n=1 Tax=Puccinia triticina (isolate 1-1 / race 1 (BBBD)) TaxID=630390 RepID=A0A180GUB5_PUCT1|nr:hypothetical protein PTTG_26478 [Puccinia triticina 1-1 BBBD Race 1]
MVEEMVKRTNKRLNRAPDNQTAIQVQGLNTLDAEDCAVVEGPAVKENLSRSSWQPQWLKPFDKKFEIKQLKPLKKETDLLLKIYGQMGFTLNAPVKPDILRASSSNAFNHNIREFRGPIPLTIFDKNWQRDAIQWYTNRRSKGDEKDGNYIGYKYPNKWSQSFSKWTTNHQNFYITFRDLYGYPEFAEWILLHKENVDKIFGEEGFMTAFQYDMILESGAISAVDISMFCKDVKQEAWRITLTLGENNETDNPYAIGGENYRYDPNTGKPRVKNQKGGEDQWKHNSGSSHGKGSYCGRGSGQWSQERRNSDYGGYNDFHQAEEGYNKRPRDHGYGDYDYHRSNDSGFNHCGGYSCERGRYGRDQGPSRLFKKKDHLSLAKEKEF